MKPAEVPAETASIPGRPCAGTPRDKVQGRPAVSGAGRLRRPRLPAVRGCRRSRPLRCRMSAATPTISRVPRSSACAAATMRRVTQEAARTPETSAIETPEIELPRIASRPRRRCARCRRRSWFRRRPPSRSIRVRRRRPPYAADAGSDPHRPTPPADIPLTRPLDLRAEVIRAVSARGHYVGRRRRAVGDEVDVPLDPGEVGSGRK